VQAGGEVYEDTRVIGLSSGSPCELRTPGTPISADRVVVASHYPLLDRGFYFARLEAKRSYCIAARFDKPVELDMAISAGEPTRSFRTFGEYLIVGGEGHPAGSWEATNERFEALEEFAREHWEVAAVTHRWSAQDPVPYDHLPMIGPYSPRDSRLFVTTGFMKWGLATAAFGAMALRDRLTGRDHEWADPFSPNRLSLRSLPEVARLGAKFTADLALDRLRPSEVSSVEEIGADEGRVVREGHRLRGVYRDPDAVLHSVSLRCTHLGCLLRFNSAERSWDCPCHGSRFDVDGNVLEGPASKPLPRVAADP
jgi:nitrite reductase/ring-hydroxylating ferredoxin subunit